MPKRQFFTPLTGDFAGYVVGWPQHEFMMFGNGMRISSDRYPGDKLERCRINGRFVSAETYRKAKNHGATP